MNKNSKLVYSTDQGRIKPEKNTQTTNPTSDGFIRIQRETKGRKGAGVMIISGFNLDEKDFKSMAKKLKKLCGSGGTVKDGVIEIQGDHRVIIKEYLEKNDFKVKLVGG